MLTVIFNHEIFRNRFANSAFNHVRDCHNFNTVEFKIENILTNEMKKAQKHEQRKLTIYTYNNNLNKSRTWVLIISQVKYLE